MKHHSELLNYLIKNHNLKSYCEIGTFNKDHNFNLINCEQKICIDPDPNAKADFIGTSDAFFETLKANDKFDIFWIDGLHHAKQVQKDFENALNHLSSEGFICLHDCNPPTELTTCVPRGAQREWCGDTYKFAIKVREYEGIEFYTIDFDYGCMVTWPNDMKKAEKPIKGMSWGKFASNRKKWLNLITVEEFLRIK